MRYTEIFKEAKRLHDLGCAVIWLHPKSKRPIGEGWTTGPRKQWKELDATFKAGNNAGIRLGTPSKVTGGFVAVIDLDVKSRDPRHLALARNAVKQMVGVSTPLVYSGRCGGSAHLYVRTLRPFKTVTPFRSDDIVKVLIPSKQPSKKERKAFTESEIEKGWRLAPAWEISLYSDGRQVVIPPSVHPDTGKLYAWEHPFKKISELPVMDFGQYLGESKAEPRVGAVDQKTKPILDGFKVEPVELSWLPISDEVRQAIMTGHGVEDRSGYLLKAATALLSADLSENEVLTVLTDPDTFLGECAYEHAKTRSRSRAAAWVHRYTLTKIVKERSPTIFKEVPAPKVRKLTFDEMAAQAEELEADLVWRDGLVRGGQHGSGPPKKLVQNVVLILKNEIGEKVVKRDLFAYRDAYDCNTPWGGKKDVIIGDDDVAMIKYWLGTNWRFEPTDNVISDALTVIACQNAFDPVKDLVDGLPPWDGVPRIDTWLKDHFEARGNAEYLAQVFRKWMFAMILRVYEPGAKFDWMPIFEGAQGIGKSSFGRLLVGDRYFLDWLPNLNDKDSALSLQGMWGVEMGELSQFRRNELENIKAFITRTVDKLRPPYGRRLIESPRRCVFFGTTNRETYLTDETGNRRFKPVVVGNLDFKALRHDRTQLFAEAKWLYDEKRETETTLELEGEAKVYEKQIHSEKMVEDDSNAMKETMLNFVEKVKADKATFNFKKFRILDLFDGAGPLTKWKPDNRNAQFASKMLKSMGAEMTRTHGQRTWELDLGTGFEGTPGTPTKQKEYE